MSILRYYARCVWWWLMGYWVCYKNRPHNTGAWCKRRSGHLGRHRTSSGFSWSKTRD